MYQLSQNRELVAGGPVQGKTNRVTDSETHAQMFGLDEPEPLANRRRIRGVLWVGGESLCIAK